MDTATVFIHSLGWALVHSVWQGALLYLLLRMLFAISPGLPSRIRYHLAYLFLIGMFAWFAGDLFSEWQRLQGVVVKVTEGAAESNGGRVFFVKALPDERMWLESGLARKMEAAFPYLIVLYAAGILIFSLRLLFGFHALSGYRSRGVQEPAKELQERFSGLISRMGIGRPVKLLLTERLRVPVVFGALKPVILIPLASLSQLSADQLEAILLHELAHVKRSDYVLNLLQTIAETVLFFNPFTWMVAGIIRREREHCCDDLVLTHTGHALPYAQALAVLEAGRLQHAAMALGATGTSNQLLNRIKRIMETRKKPTNYSYLIVVGALVAGLVFSALWLTPAVAQSRKEKGNTPERVAERKTSRIIVIDEDGNRREYRDTDELPASVRRSINESISASGLAVASAGEALKIADDVLRAVDIPGITREVTRSLQEVRLSDLTAEVDRALADVDWESINRDLEDAMYEVREELRDPKLREEVRRSLREAETDLAQASEAAKEDMAKAREELVEARGRLARARDSEAGVSRDRALATTGGSGKAGTGYENMLEQMEDEGLLDRGKEFSVRKKGDRLYINGKLQNDRTMERYKDQLRGKEISIDGKGNSLSIAITN